MEFVLSNFADIFEEGAAQVFDHLFDATVVLSRGSNSSDSFGATWLAEEYSIIDHETGLSIAVRRRTYILQASLCVINSSEVEPREGDRLTDGSDTFKLLPVDGRPAVEEVVGGHRWRVRTNKLA